MSNISRRQFVQQTAFAAAAMYASPKTLEPQPTSEGVKGSVAALDSVAVRKLGSQLSGRLITTRALDYETARLVFNRAFDQHPALIVRCATESDVARALEFTRKWALPLAVRAGGHSRAGFGVCEGGLVIDLSGMKGVEVDGGKRVARAQGGALLRHLDEVMEPFDGYDGRRLSECGTCRVHPRRRRRHPDVDVWRRMRQPNIGAGGNG